MALKIDDKYIQIISVIFGIFGVFFNQPLLLAIFLYVACFYFIRFIRPNIFSYNLFSWGIILPLFLGIYSYQVPDRTQFLIFLIPILTFAYSSIPRFSSFFISRLLRLRTIPKGFIEHFDFLAIIFMMLLVIQPITYPFILFAQQMSTSSAGMWSDWINIFNYTFQTFFKIKETILPIFLIMTILLIIQPYRFLLKNKRSLGIKLCKAQLLVVLFLSIYMLSIIYYLITFIVYPVFHRIISYVFEVSISQNAILCKNNNSYNLLFNNPFKSTICKLETYSIDNQTLRGFSRYFLPNDEIKETITIENSTLNLNKYSIMCGIFYSGLRDITNC